MQYFTSLSKSLTIQSRRTSQVPVSTTPNFFNQNEDENSSEYQLLPLLWNCRAKTFVSLIIFHKNSEMILIMNFGKNNYFTSITKAAKSCSAFNSLLCNVLNFDNLEHQSNIPYKVSKRLKIGRGLGFSNIWCILYF